MGRFFKKHWPALLVLALASSQLARDGVDDLIRVLLLGVMATGLLMNLLVIALNNGMPVATTHIDESEKADYHPITPQTRLPWLADWIDAGWAYLSPGDILIDLGAFLFILRLIF